MTVSLQDAANIAANVYFFRGEAGIPSPVPGWDRKPDLAQFYAFKQNFGAFAPGKSTMTMGLRCRDYGASLLNPRLATRLWKIGTPFGQRLQQAPRRHRWRDRCLFWNKK
jgi:hypothetical protein